MDGTNDNFGKTQRHLYVSRRNAMPLSQIKTLVDEKAFTRQLLDIKGVGNAECLVPMCGLCCQV